MSETTKFYVLFSRWAHSRSEPSTAAEPSTRSPRFRSARWPTRAQFAT